MLVWHIEYRIKLLTVSLTIKRLGKMEELHDTIEYLIKTEYISGTSIKINGGISV